MSDNATPNFRKCLMKKTLLCPFDICKSFIQMEHPSDKEFKCLFKTERLIEKRRTNKLHKRHVTILFPIVTYFLFKTR